jgi:hypothetical protein
VPNSLTALDRGRPSALAKRRRSTLLDNARAALPASYAVVTYKGRNFRLKYRSEETLLRDANRRPASFIDVVIIGVSPSVSRQYFARAYSEGDSDAPVCYATDGITPDVGVEERQSPLCATCKWSQWGSRVTDNGKRAKACQETRRIAIVPLGDIENEVFGGPMLLRIPPMSLHNLSNYADFLSTKGASFETVATRISFDEDVAYPRLTFETLDWLSDEQQQLATGEDGESGMIAHPLIERMLGASEMSERASAPRPAPIREPSVNDDEDDQPDSATEPGTASEPAPLAARPTGGATFAQSSEPDEPDEPAEQPPPRQRRAASNANGGNKPARKPGNGATIQVEADLESALDSLLGE